ncbi:uncharacterized protein BDZ99DRAFT_480246 [Mytilinidion resinicola]|uniref:AN1-type domain-containing protein n=1 Tax=Mytilinidion resinicola TaxID=574789 RepID=A0A6A6Y9P4_9PEZI|nr:uncharacterized protein BDZ99DRAFT_480246 [Mytilinidion resinicola]KAF2805536.1 hypothetical protein BDZ99DRAFT_480246 [Mytilinidion resinicola]
MAKGDVEAIGAHCQMAYCHQLDFLPFRCESCKGTFCLDHRTETAHSCKNEGAWARARREAELKKSSSTPPMRSSLLTPQPCASSSCKEKINTPLKEGIHCTTCRRYYCVKHRLPEDHDCKNLIPLGTRPKTTVDAQREKALGAFSKFKEWNRKISISTASKAKDMEKLVPKSKATVSAANARNALMDLKKNAKGEASIPQDKRVYLLVEASADTTKAKHPSGKFFYNKEWSVGRVLDAASKALQVENVNNRGGGEEAKLRVFHVEGGRLLDFSEKIGAPCVSGNTVVLLRGVGPPAPDLIEV